jgi:hypothetical protein
MITEQQHQGLIREDVEFGVQSTTAMKARNHREKAANTRRQFRGRSPKSDAGGVDRIL